MTMSVDVEAPSFLQDPYASKSRGRCRVWHAWILAVLAAVLIALNSVLLRAFNRLQGDYETLAERIDSHTSDVQPAYRWPVKSDDLHHYECLYPVGGGSLSHTGVLPQARLSDPKQCKGVLDWYFSPGVGQYWKDLEHIRDSALEFLTASETFKKGDSKNMVVFDIDETVLSNLASIQEREYVPVPDNQTRVHDMTSPSPALDAIKDIYLKAYDYGMSTAFITGRSEDSRDYTEKNLKAVGLGVKCVQDGQGNVIRSKGTPCYVGLHLRDLKNDMHKLASVYKPERRKQLIDAGYTIVATFGDQFSDSDGLHSALATYKMPNPLYYIL
eukprot:jgi/Ulvmu1/9903/UM057_0060.1